MIVYDEDISKRPHRLTVLRYNANIGCHGCRVEGFPYEVRVDFLSCGSLPAETQPEDLIGKTIEVDFTHGLLWLAEGARIIETPAALAEKEG